MSRHSWSSSGLLEQSTPRGVLIDHHEIGLLARVLP